jgi:Outer membrane protein beta-barrel domain
MIKRVGVSALLLLATVSRSEAQANQAEPVIVTDNAAPDFSLTSAAEAKGSLAVVDFLADTDRTSPAEPAPPSPNPRFVYGSRNDYRWQLSLGFTWVRFQSSVFDSNEFGVKTTVTYFLNEWLGVEGSITAAFGGAVFGGQDAKIAVYGGGPKVVWRQNRWEPWLHGIFGGAHQGPQTAADGRNSYSIMAGGGADYRVNPHLSYRAEADYVQTAFFHQTQHNFELVGGVVIHF